MSRWPESRVVHVGCSQCLKPLKRLAYELKIKKKFFCDRRCQNSERTNKPVPWLFTPEVIKRRSATKSGPRNNRWKGGICSDPAYLSWKKNERNRRKRLAEGSHTFEQWLELKQKHSNTCLACLRKEPEIRLTQDHIVPVSKGGSDNIENIQPLCRGCNTRKSNRTIDYAKNAERTD